MPNPALTTSLLDDIRAEASQLGFDHVAVSQPTISDRDRQAYLIWCEQGGAAGMAYMSDSSKRLNLGETFPGVKSILSLGISYYQGAFPPKPGPAYGKVARYAWGLDYHEVIAERLTKLIERINFVLGGAARASLAVDSKPLLERAIASSSGLGFVGKNTVLIIPRADGKMRTGFHVGSWIFLAEVLLDVQCVDASPTEIQQGCGGCTKCLVACPTKAFEGPYRLRSDRCISYLTIENKGWISHELRPLLGDWIFGCDICQDVCPFNARAFETTWPEFSSEKGAGPWISLREILESDIKEFKRRWGKTPLLRAKRKGLVRNACIAAGNSGDGDLIQPLQNLLQDDEPMVRGHALWAISKLSPGKTTAELVKHQLTIEKDQLVLDECRIALDGN